MVSRITVLVCVDVLVEPGVWAGARVDVGAGVEAGVGAGEGGGRPVTGAAY